LSRQDIARIVRHVNKSSIVTSLASYTLRVNAFPKVTRAAIGLAFLCVASQASAQTNNQTLAERNYNDGVNLMNAGKISAGCSMLAESLRLDRTRGTLLTLAQCHEKDRKWASAWGEYLDAAALYEKPEAGKEPKLERAKEARDAAKRIEPNLQRVQFAPKEIAPESTFKFDEQELGERVIKAPVLADPGEHRVLIKAPGRKEAVVTFTLVEKAGSITPVDLPALAVDDAGKPAASGAPPKLTVTTDTSVGRSQRTTGWIIAGAGAAVGITGGVVAVVGILNQLAAVKDVEKTLEVTYARKNQNPPGKGLPSCDNFIADGLDGEKTKDGSTLSFAPSANLTNPAVLARCQSARKSFDSGRTMNIVGAVIGGVGAAALITGIVVVLTAPSPQTTVKQGKEKKSDFAIRPEFGLGSMGVSGTF
jgi:hypothetical protein